MLTFQPQVQVPPDPLVLRFLDPMRRVLWTWALLSRYLPIEVTSWWRPQSATVSQHQLGTAIDALSPAYSRAQLLPLVQWAGNHFGVSVPSAPSETSGRSVHVQGLPFGLTEQILQANPSLIASATSFIGPPRPL
jgi:hypothetical protein